MLRSAPTGVNEPSSKKFKSTHRSTLFSDLPNDCLSYVLDYNTPSELIQLWHDLSGKVNPGLQLQVAIKLLSDKSASAELVAKIIKEFAWDSNFLDANKNNHPLMNLVLSKLHLSNLSTVTYAYALYIFQALQGGKFILLDEQFKIALKNIANHSLSPVETHFIYLIATNTQREKIATAISEELESFDFELRSKATFRACELIHFNPNDKSLRDRWLPIIRLNLVTTIDSSIEKSKSHAIFHKISSVTRTPSKKKYEHYFLDHDQLINNVQSGLTRDDNKNTNHRYLVNTIVDSNNQRIHKIKNLHAILNMLYRTKPFLDTIQQQKIWPFLFTQYSNNFGIDINDYAEIGNKEAINIHDQHFKDLKAYVERYLIHQSYLVDTEYRVKLFEKVYQNHCYNFIILRPRIINLCQQIKEIDLDKIINFLTDNLERKEIVIQKKRIICLYIIASQIKSDKILQAIIKVSPLLNTNLFRDSALRLNMLSATSYPHTLDHDEAMSTLIDQIRSADVSELTSQSSIIIIGLKKYLPITSYEKRSALWGSLIIRFAEEPAQEFVLQLLTSIKHFSNEFDGDYLINKATERDKTFTTKLQLKFASIAPSGFRHFNDIWQDLLDLINADDSQKHHQAGIIQLLNLLPKAAPEQIHRAIAPLHKVLAKNDFIDNKNGALLDCILCYLLQAAANKNYQIYLKTLARDEVYLKLILQIHQIIYLLLEDPNINNETHFIHQIKFLHVFKNANTQLQTNEVIAKKIDNLLENGGLNFAVGLRALSSNFTEGQRRKLSVLFIQHANGTVSTLDTYPLLSLFVDLLPVQSYEHSNPIVLNNILQAGLDVIKYPGNRYFGVFYIFLTNLFLKCVDGGKYACLDFNFLKVEDFKTGTQLPQFALQCLLTTLNVSKKMYFNDADLGDEKDALLPLKMLINHFKVILSTEDNIILNICLDLTFDVSKKHLDERLTILKQDDLENSMRMGGVKRTL